MSPERARKGSKNTRKWLRKCDGHSTTEMSSRPILGVGARRSNRDGQDPGQRKRNWMPHGNEAPQRGERRLARDRVWRKGVCTADLGTVKPQGVQTPRALTQTAHSLWRRVL